ncbi:unnamed protein product [Ambrosiozyma monospora]|uniref:Unnamed protein product n=1 Tax=Ambrosiozyma monospora TaxID=43982 RepID=A0A9W6Z3C1_AMBMO|nr:unnamed protein product [Ambrosiozyma monospora]
MPSLSELIPKFQFEKLLNSDSQLKVIAILGTIEGQHAILSLEKTHFNYTEQEQLENLPITEIETLVNNDVYYWGMNLLKQDLKNSPSSKLNLIYPATETHIRKFNKPKMHIIKETPEAYETIVKPYISTMKGDRIKWVKNILFHGAEADRVVCKNDDFILLPDMKWDGKSLESLYLCAIVFREDISSVRDLNESHVDYLERILKEIREEVPKYYSKGLKSDEDDGEEGDGDVDGDEKAQGNQQQQQQQQQQQITADSLRIYIHYQPSYYHFHVHVVNANYNGLGESIIAGKAILLDEVIDNLKLLGKGGYSKKTMHYSLNESHALWELGLKNHVV